jgi:hypothetical protein
LKTLKTLLPLASHPIIVADSGFRVPFYRYVEHTLGWYWVGRIRNRDFIRWQNTTDSWFSATSLYSKATTKPTDWVRCSGYGAARLPLFSSWFANPRKDGGDATNRVSRVSRATVKNKPGAKKNPGYWWPPYRCNRSPPSRS